MGYKSPLNMFPADRWRQRFFLGGGAALTYDNKVLGHDPIAYWPLWETSGLVANCLVNPAQNGTYTGVTLGQPGIGDGNTCPLFDGANDYVDILSAALTAAYNHEEGSMIAWAKVFNVGTWTDGVARQVWRLTGPAAHPLQYFRQAVPNNRLEMDWNSNDGVGWNFLNLTENGVVTVDWMFITVTWSLAGGWLRGYRNAVLFDTDVLNRGEVNQPSSSFFIGAATAVPVEVWYGWIQHLAIFDSPLAQPAITDLYTV